MRQMKILQQALNPESLPQRVPAPLAAVVASCHVRTLDREAKKGRLEQFRQNKRAIYYDRDQLLALIGIKSKPEEETQTRTQKVSKPARRRPKTGAAA
jgi:hypothetical protein